MPSYIVSPSFEGLDISWLNVLEHWSSLGWMLFVTALLTHKHSTVFDNALDLLVGWRFFDRNITWAGGVILCIFTQIRCDHRKYFYFLFSWVVALLFIHAVKYVKDTSHSVITFCFWIISLVIIEGFSSLSLLRRFAFLNKWKFNPLQLSDDLFGQMKALGTRA